MAESVARVARYEIELNDPLVNLNVPGLLVQNDKLADTVVLAVTKGGQAATLTGATAFGEFERPVDGAKIRCAGTVSGGTITIPLLDQCYKYAGSFVLIIRCNDGSRERSLMRLSGYVERGGDGVIIDPSGSIPSYGDLEQAIANCNAAAAAATAAKNELLQAKADGEFTGPQGPQGPTGPQGAAGPQGATGATPNLTMGTVTTGAPGTQAGASFSGTAEEPVLNLVIPRGDTGAVDGVDYYEGTPEALGTASPGTANGLSRGNHVHPMPTADQIPVASGESQTVGASLTSIKDTVAAKVATVNGKSPENGAVTLGAADIAAADGETVQAKLAALEARPQGGATEHTATLTAAGWTGDSAPYTQTVTVTGLAADAHLIVGLAPTVTAEEMEAAAAAMLLATGQAAGSITISAFGDKPEAALPILIMEVG